MKSIILVAFLVAFVTVVNSLPAPGERSEAYHGEPAGPAGVPSENDAPIEIAQADTGTLYR